MEISSIQDGWHGNKLSIDEITDSKRCKRHEWIDVSIDIFKLVALQIEIPKSFLIFMHYDLGCSKRAFTISQLKLDWLQMNLDLSTPPSLNITSDEYFDSFYKSELIPIVPDIKMASKFGPMINRFSFFRRSFFVESDGTYLNLIYIFLIDNYSVVS